MHPRHRQVGGVSNMVDRGPVDVRGDTRGREGEPAAQHPPQRLDGGDRLPLPRDAVIAVTQQHGAPGVLAAGDDRRKRLEIRRVVVPLDPVPPAGGDVSPVPGDAGADNAQRASMGLRGACHEAAGRTLRRAESIDPLPRVLAPGVQKSRGLGSGPVPPSPAEFVSIFSARSPGAKRWFRNGHMPAGQPLLWFETVTCLRASRCYGSRKSQRRSAVLLKSRDGQGTIPADMASRRRGAG